MKLVDELRKRYEAEQEVWDSLTAPDPSLLETVLTELPEDVEIKGVTRITGGAILVTFRLADRQNFVVTFYDDSETWRMFDNHAGILTADFWNDHAFLSALYYELKKRADLGIYGE